MCKVFFSALLFWFVFSVHADKAPVSYQIDTSAPSDIEDLAILGKVWGFLKYHHPSVASGAYHWDEKLIELLPIYMSSASHAREQILNDWVVELGIIQLCNDCESTSKLGYLNPDLTWIESDISLGKLQSTLRMIYAHRHRGPSHYVSLVPGVGNPEFHNEFEYASTPYPNLELRLVSLFRLWNIVEYFFPYKYQTDKEWNSVLADYISEFVNASDETQYQLAVLKLLGELHDTHANLWEGHDAIQEWKGHYYPPVRTTIIEEQLVVSDYYIHPNRADFSLRLGDVITHIEGIPVNEHIEKKLPYYPASNMPTKLRDLAPELLRSKKKQIAITVKNQTGQSERELSLYELAELPFYYQYQREANTDEPYYLLQEGIGYINLKDIVDRDIPRIKKAFYGLDAIVIDIRNYPSGFYPFQLGGYFMRKTTPFVKFTKVDLTTPGRFSFNPSLSIPKDKKTFKGKLVVLVNEVTQSMAEYTTMALQAGNDTTIIGSTTAAADGNISFFYLPGGLKAAISGIGVYYPDGKQTQRIGIIPDILVQPTINGVRDERDELIERAIQYINEN